MMSKAATYMHETDGTTFIIPKIVSTMHNGQAPFGAIRIVNAQCQAPFGAIRIVKRPLGAIRIVECKYVVNNKQDQKQDQHTTEFLAPMISG